MCQAGFHNYNKIPEIPLMRERLFWLSVGGGSMSQWECVVEQSHSSQHQEAKKKRGGPVPQSPWRAHLQ